MAIEEREKYYKAYYENEYDANKHMSFALLFTSILIALIWILYLIPGVFAVTKATRIVTCIILPILVLILVSPQLWIRKDYAHKPGFKYFLLISFIAVIATINVIMPKHGILGWAIVIILTNHYYNPKLGKVIFAVTMVSMLICIYAGMFFGEYDSNLLMGELDDKTSLIHHFSDYSLTFPDTPQGRYEYLSYLLSYGKLSYNRYVTALVFYYLARAVIITIIFFVSNGLNKRTYNLLVNEINVGISHASVSKELQIAGDIQQSMVPDPYFIDENIEIIASLDPSKEMGGDFYDYYLLDDNHVAIIIGDVSGKGAPAALFMTKTITCFKNFTTVDKSPSQIMKEVNHAIYQGNNSEMFVTCFLAILDMSNQKLRFANAGHNPPIISKNDRFIYLPCKNGFLLGGMEECLASDEEIDFLPGEVITLYTDGLSEAMNAKREQYGKDRLLSVFNKKEYSCLLELHHTVKDDIEEFVAGEEQSDDMTYLSLKYHGDKCTYQEQIFAAKKENIQEMLEFIGKFLNDLKLDKSFIHNGKVVADELLSNIVKYAYDDQDGSIYIRQLYNFDKKIFVITFIDKGKEFDPFTVNNAPLEGDANSNTEGGLGILIIKKLMSEYAYDRINGKNIVTLKKQF